MSRYIGLDYGSKTLGVAVSSPENITAFGITTLTRKDELAFRPLMKGLKPIIREHNITHAVIGYPRLANGDEGERCRLTLMFKDKLERYFKFLTIVLWDERFSTFVVSQTTKTKEKVKLDEMSAVYILQGFLDNLNQEGNRVSKETDSINVPNDNEEVVLINDDGEEMPFSILASKEVDGEMYILAADEEEGDVLHFKCIPADEEDLILELIEEDHEDYKKVFELFSDDYETLGIDIE